jgi:beta-glucosidase
VAAESIVLLKNEGDLLPLRKNLGSIAVIGPHADSPRLLQGDYHYPAHLETMQAEGPESAVPTPEHPFRGDLSQLYPPMVTILAGLKAAAGAGPAVRYAQGCDVTDPSPAGFEAALEAARQSDVAVVVVGARSGLTHQSTDGEAVDRARSTCPAVQQQLVEAVAATGTPVVVVLVNGRPLALPWIAEHIPAVLETWIPGEEGGSAVAECSLGMSTRPGGCPCLCRAGWPGAAVLQPQAVRRRSHWYGDYVDMSVRPLYPFGHA